MAGHAPEITSWRERITRWLEHASDLQISLFMLTIAAGVVGLLVALEWGLFV